METRIINWGVDEIEIEEIVVVDKGDCLTICDRSPNSPIITFPFAGNEILSKMLRNNEKYKGYDIAIAPGAILERECAFFKTSCKYLFAPSVVRIGKIIHDSILAPEDDFWREFVRRYR